METIATHSGLALEVGREISEEHVEITLRADGSRPCVLHWGLCRRGQAGWVQPPEEAWPAHTQVAGGALQTPITGSTGGEGIVLRLPAKPAYTSLEFVLFYPEKKQWDNNQGRNYRIALSQAPAQPIGLEDAAARIIEAEMEHNSWTLMHRFNLCYDLLEETGGSVEGLALLFVWLRYSALRQLTWQRNYNTKPRELSHAEDRLTQQLARLYAQNATARPLLRLLLGCVGPGGDGQRIRDEILNIMHRHHVKEVSGHFLEEWHQKLHNNTTPDDIVICEAYIEFLISNGNLERFYGKLKEGGVTKQRLESFERPIRTAPDLVPHIRDGLIYDFQNFLRIVRSVHEGTDLETAVNHGRGYLDGETQGLMGRILEHRHGQFPLLAQVDEITEARRRLHARLSSGEASRELIYLDLALEQYLRLLVERNLGHSTDGHTLVEMVRRMLENRLLSEPDAELSITARHWERLQGQPRFGADWALHAKSVTDRVARVLGNLIDRSYALLQPKADLLGAAFKAEAWTITLFSEEVVRGNSLNFVLSMLLRNLEPLLRKAARVGNWQIVSRGTGTGMVEVVSSLREVQGKTFDAPRVVVACHVAGDEDIPERVAAVIAPDVTDIVSHVAVRARNAGLLFASCYDPETFARLKELRGRTVCVSVNAAGDVIVEESAASAVAGGPARARAPRARASRPSSAPWVLSASEFTAALTGGKSLNLAGLAGKLPAWVRRPASMALPFGTCERVLESEPNTPLALQYRSLQERLDGAPERILSELRETILKLAAPAGMAEALRRKAGEAGLDWTGDWPGAWERIKRVWASKWNDRAYYSRKTQGIADDDLFMAVLVQEVIPADYAFVLHTANPVTGRRQELYAEVVTGLGETLVGNYPGRSLSAVCEKKTGTPNVLAYPGKSVTLRGGGLIFRSDSNGEDLADFAGAGLYDSVLLPEARASLADYTSEPLVWDENFRAGLLRRLAELGSAVEGILGSPQDIEGVVSKGDYYLVQTRPQVGIPNE